MTRCHQIFASLWILSVAMMAGSADAAINVGDKPTLKFKTFDGTGTVDLADLKGKIVVVDFWASWCHPCMEEAPHMVKINKDFAAKGVQLIGISLDSKSEDMKKAIKDKEMTWPMSFNDNLQGAWGVTGIPQTFIIGPDGTVLWSGHPAGIDAPLADALKNHPPQLVDSQTLAIAKTKLNDVESALTANEPAKAVKAMAAVPETAKLDTETAARIKTDTDKLAEYGKTQLDAVDALLSNKNYSKAVNQLQNLTKVFAGTDTGAAAKKKLTAIGNDPEVKKAIAASKNNDKADAALKVADKFKADNKGELAYPAYQKIVAIYTGTPAAVEAADAVKTYEADTTFITAYRTKTNATRAASILSMADSDRTDGATDKAKELYRKIICDYPGTTAAETAKATLKQMEN